MDDMVYIAKVMYTNSGGWMYMGSISREIKATTTYYETPDRAAKEAMRFIENFVESYNREKRDFEADTDNLARVTDYSFEVIPFSRKEMMIMKLKGKENE